MTIDKALNLVVAARTQQRVVEEDGKKRLVNDILISAFHTPITRDVFEANYRIIAAKRDLFAGISSITDARALMAAYTDAAKVATYALVDAARADAIAHGDDDPPARPPAAGAFLAELERRTWILAPTDAGFDQVPAAIAVSRGIIDADEWAEALSGIVFFTVAWQMSRKADREWMAPLWASVLPGLTTSSSLLEYLASLQTLTPSATSESAPVSSPTS